MQDDLISVIVPVYKVEEYLDRCVNSIVNQTYKNLEIILIDDGSPDNCPEMCDEWAKKDQRIKVIHKQNGGLSDARNAGMEIATGEYIGFVDSDDWIAPEMYEKLIVAMKKDSCDIEACCVEMVWENGSDNRLLTQKQSCVLTSEEAQLALLKESLLKQPVWYKLYKANKIKNIAFEKGKYHEDVFWSYKAIGAANKVGIIDYIGYYYLQRNASIMGEGYSLKRLDAIEAYCQRFEYIKENFPNLSDLALINVWYGCIYNGQQILLYLKGNERQKALDYLKKTMRRYPLHHKNYSKEKLTQRLWLDMSRLSLVLTCKIRNFLNIGN